MTCDNEATRDLRVQAQFELKPLCAVSQQPHGRGLLERYPANAPLQLRKGLERTGQHVAGVAIVAVGGVDVPVCLTRPDGAVLGK